ncbi:ATP synthase F0 subunit B [Xylanibacillus composti]|uniref:ATP synthase subunit b n=1 Tax=Xylanibacillus composti TaxID=1572762 RepID=A0A8J4M474_9BACL|nr:F0F1 ATP synthase subunit B [Xylanibacillus composti]MDT9725993.1 ATP synthase F0 subunit B [Xylanibacillus composti]GIQ70852.1 ATP synthase subunit b [Xylanibacillus composti]
MHLYWESIVFAIIAFGILYWLLNKYAFGPLFSIMEKRREKVVGELSEAEASRKQAEQYLAEQKQAVEDARKEAYEMLEQAKKTSSKQAEDILAQANAEAARLKEDALKEIENEKNKAVVALRNEVSAMSVLIASKIIEKQIDEKSQEELINKYLKEVGGNV